MESKYTKLKVNLLTPKQLLDVYYEKGDFSSSLSRLDNIVIQLHVKTSLVDICYAEYKKNRLDSTDVYVVKKSLNPNYKVIVTAVLNVIVNLHQDGKVDVTVYYCFRNISHFLGWLSKHKFPSTLEDAKTLLINYIYDLRCNMRQYDKLKKKGMSSISARKHQNLAIQFLMELFNKERDSSYFHSGLDKIIENANELEPVSPLSQEDYADQFNFYTLLFRQCANVLLKAKPIPFKLELVYGDFHCSPYSKNLFGHSSQNSFGKAFNFSNGKFYTVEEFVSKYQVSEAEAYRYLGKGKKAMECANRPESNARRLIVGYALKSYFMHFLFLTGMNDSSAARLKYNDNISVDKSTMHFSNVKWRAQGKNVTFEIQSEFMSDFQLYIKLRDYVLSLYRRKKHAESYLFLGSVFKGIIRPFPLDGGASFLARKRLEVAFGYKFSLGSSQEIRTTKSIWVRNKFGSTVESWILQHSVYTSQAHYTGRNDNETTAEEMTDFFNALSAELKKEDTTDTVVGHCSELSRPEPILVGSPPVKIDCSFNEGCLFCSKYRMHADGTDVHKLLSLKFLIQESQELAHNRAHFSNVYRDTLYRIDELISNIKKISLEKKDMVEGLEFKVFDQGLLTPYWQQRLEMYINLGLF